VTEGTIATLYAHGTPTFVVGFNAQADRAELDRFAAAGGVPSTDPTDAYYPAQDDRHPPRGARRDRAAHADVRFPLTGDPPCAGEHLRVLRLGRRYAAVGESTSDGWSHDAAGRKLVFNGPACDKVRSGAITGVYVVYGPRLRRAMPRGGGLKRPVIRIPASPAVPGLRPGAGRFDRAGEKAENPG